MTTVSCFTCCVMWEQWWALWESEVLELAKRFFFFIRISHVSNTFVEDERRVMKMSLFSLHTSCFLSAPVSAFILFFFKCHSSFLSIMIPDTITLNPIGWAANCNNDIIKANFSQAGVAFSNFQSTWSKCSIQVRGMKWKLVLQLFFWPLGESSCLHNAGTSEAFKLIWHLLIYTSINYH